MLSPAARAFPEPRDTESVEASDSYVVDEDGNEDILNIALGDEYASYFEAAGDDSEEPILDAQQAWRAPPEVDLAPAGASSGDEPRAAKKRRVGPRERIAALLRAPAARKLIGDAQAMVDHLAAALGASSKASRNALKNADRDARFEWTAKKKSPEAYADAFLRKLPEDFAAP
jgi:hypothetical protein